MPRPQPRFPERDSKPFWRATKDHRLTYQTCNNCRTVVFYPKNHCANCGSSDLKWNDSKGEGVVYTYSVVRANRSPLFRDDVPYTVAYVDLDEGFRMMTNIVDVAPEDVKIGMRVKVKWDDQEEVALPFFAPA
jgi:uncharacterized OB-fold protein